MCIRDRGYTLSYYNCDEPKITARYSLKSTCAQHQYDELGNSTSDWDLLQQIDFSEVSGFSCQLVVTHFYLMCGAFSHVKFEKVPEVELSETVSVATCRSWARNKKFQTKDGNKHALSVPGVTILSLNDLGVLDPSGSVACQGQSLKIGSQVVEQSLILSQYRVIVSKELYRLKTGTNVEVLSSHTRLPKSCRPKSGSCATDTVTYFWSPELPRCKLEKLSTLHGIRSGNYIVDKHQKLVIKLLSSVPAPNGCGMQSIFQTPYRHVFIAEHSEYKWPTFETSEIYLPAFSRALSDYVLWESEKGIREAIRRTKEDLCADKMDFPASKYHKIHDDLYATRRGDVAYVFRCIKETGTLFDASRCFSDIPIKDHNRHGGTDQVYYVDPITRIKKQVTAPSKCSEEFPLEVKTDQNVFIKITPRIVKVLTPEDKPAFKLGEFHHEDMANRQGSTGLYSNKEVSIAVQHVHEEDYRDAVTKTISYGSMSYNGVFDDRDYQFDISKLSPVTILKEMDIFQKVDNFLRRWGAWLSLAVLLLEIARLVMTLAMIGYSLIQDGILGAKAICYSLLCTKIYSTQSQLERAKRRRLRSQEDDAEMRNLKDDRGVDTSEI